MTNYDDGNWNWKHECQYISPPTTDTDDWSYEIVFHTKYGGYLNGGEITCFYWQSQNLLQIIKGKNSLDFYVENFSDIKAIITPMIKANMAKPYPIYESITSKRKQKLKKINEITSRIKSHN